MKKILFLVFFCPLIANAQIITTVAGNGLLGYSGDGGIATTAEISGPSRIALDISGNVYMINGGNRIRKIDASTGVIYTVAGNGISSAGGCDTVGNGIPAIATKLSSVFGISTDASSNFYTSCHFFSKKVTIGTGIMDTILSGIRTYNIVFDKANNMYFDNTTGRIYKRDVLTGTITLIAGNGSLGSSGNGGPATAAALDEKISGLAIDTNNILYISGTTSNIIRKVDLSTNIISAFAGTGSKGYSGDGFNATSAQINDPEAIGVDKYGNVYIADEGNNVVRKVDVATGIISTIAGTPIPGYSGDGGPAVIAQLNHPYDVKVDTSGNIFIADGGNNRIRKITPPPTSVKNICTKPEIMLYPNPAHNKLTVVAEDKINEVTIVNLLGQIAYTQKFTSEKAELDLTTIIPGIYLIKINEINVRRFIKE